MADPTKFKYELDDVVAMINYYFATTPMMDLTVTGLAMVFGSKQLLQDYAKRPLYSAVIAAAKLRVENAYEIRLKKQHSGGVVFALKNFGWSDKTEMELYGKSGGPITTREEPATIEELEAEMKRRGIPVPER